MRLIEEDQMRRVTAMSLNKVARRIAPIAVAATLCLGATACGSTSKLSPNNAPAVTVPGGTNAPTTSAPKPLGAGF